MGIKFAVIILGWMALAGCAKNPLIPPATGDNETVEYVIKKGSHYSDGSRLELIRYDAIHCAVQFDSTAIYTSLDAGNQGDVNKLIGFSDCGSDHQQNSARIGWSWNGKGVLLYAYCYVNGERVIKTLTLAPLHTPIDCTVAAEGKYYQFSINGVRDSVARHCEGYSGTRYKLFPYFGGDETAPHDIHIKINALGGSN